MIEEEPEGGWSDEAELLIEALPECPGCGRTHTYHVGAKDMTSLMLQNKKALARLLAK